MNICIIGGGISGISLAIKLVTLKQQVNDINVTLFEKDSILGGTIKSINRDGFIVESGANGFLDSKPSTLEIFNEAGLSNKLVKSNDKARKRFIQRYNELQLLPENPKSFLQSKLLSSKGKLRLAGEFFIPQKVDNIDESLADFATRRLGREALDYLIGPMVSGVFAGDPEKMSLESCFPVIKELETKYGGLIKGLLKKPKKKSGPAGPGGVLTSYEGGMGNAIHDLGRVAEAKGVNILLSSPVDQVIKQDNQYKVISNNQEYIFDIIVVTAPAYASCKFLQSLDNRLSDILSTIPYAPMFVAGLGFNSDDLDHDIDGFGYLIPKKENRNILGALFTSSMFPMQAPNNTKFLRIMAGGDANREIMQKSDDQLLELCINDVKDILGIKADPYMTQIFRAEKAIPQYYLGHREKVKEIEEITQKLGNVYIGGNVLYGIGVNDCTRTSINIANKIKNIQINTA